MAETITDSEYMKGWDSFVYFNFAVCLYSLNKNEPKHYLQSQRSISTCNNYIAMTQQCKESLTNKSAKPKLVNLAYYALLYKGNIKIFQYYSRLFN